MPSSKDGDTVRGSCFCGAITFELTLPVAFCGHCHCTMCQRAHGAGYVTWIGTPKERFRFLSGEDNVKEFASSDHGTRGFCDACGSTLFCESTKRPEEIDIVLANIEGDVGLAPAAHFYYANKAPWIHIEDDLPRIEESSA